MESPACWAHQIQHELQALASHWPPLPPRASGHSRWAVDGQGEEGTRPKGLVGLLGLGLVREGPRAHGLFSCYTRDWGGEAAPFHVTLKPSSAPSLGSDRQGWTPWAQGHPWRTGKCL